MSCPVSGLVLQFKLEKHIYLEPDHCNLNYMQKNKLPYPCTWPCIAFPPRKFAAKFYLAYYYISARDRLDRDHLQSDLQLPVQSVPITTKLVSSNPVHGEVYSIEHYVIKFVTFSVTCYTINQPTIFLPKKINCLVTRPFIAIQPKENNLSYTWPSIAFQPKRRSYVVPRLVLYFSLKNKLSCTMALFCMSS